MTPNKPTPSDVPRRRVPVSIVCVYNDEAALASSLRHSVLAQADVAPETELLAIDNREGRFSTAGAALNYGARMARNEVVAFVHQDVVLHSLPSLEEVAAELLSAEDIGLLGAVGIDRSHRIIGKMRDRIVQIGDPAPTPRDVETLDEVLLMTTTAQVLRAPLSEEPLLAWHAYGVEYALRMRRGGLRAVARDIPLTHNSLSTNLAKLDLAHRHVGDTYPELLPIHTTCGIVYRSGETPVLVGARQKYKSALIWWDESQMARAAHGISPDSKQVIADIRMLIDEAMQIGGKQSLRVVDLDPDAIADYTDQLTRFDRPFVITAADLGEAHRAVDSRDPDELLFLSGLSDESLSALAPFGEQPHVLGNSGSTGRWALIGITAAELQPLWPSWRNRPIPGFA